MAGYASPGLSGYSGGSCPLSPPYKVDYIDMHIVIFFPPQLSRVLVPTLNSSAHFTSALNSEHKNISKLVCCTAVLDNWV